MLSLVLSLALCGFPDSAHADIKRSRKAKIAAVNFFTLHLAAPLFFAKFGAGKIYYVFCV